MIHTKSAAFRAGTQQSCVQTQPAGFAPILRRDVLRALRKTRTRIGLSTGDVMVLDALMSFLPCRERGTGSEGPVTADMMLIIYASNSTICDRANAMSDRVLRRHIKRLADAGLLCRRDSATGKRFPLRTGGKVISAYGLDLTPLFEGAGDLEALASEVDQEADEARSLRAEALTLRAELLRRSENLAPAALEFVDHAKTILRRTSLGVTGISEVLAHLREIAGCHPAPASPDPAPRAEPDVTRSVDHGTRPGRHSRPSHESAGNGQNVRQEEPPKIDTYTPITPPSGEDIWARYKHIAALYPKPPISRACFQEIVYSLGRFLGLKDRTLAQAIAALGWTRALETLDYLIGAAARIERPDAYLLSIIKKSVSGSSVTGRHAASPLES